MQIKLPLFKEFLQKFLKREIDLIEEKTISVSVSNLKKRDSKLSQENWSQELCLSKEKIKEKEASKVNASQR